MKDTWTADMHAEMTIDAETAIKHKAACVWKLLGTNYSPEQLSRYCSLYHNPAQALHYRPPSITPA
jgi:hypothetical protein